MLFRVRESWVWEHRGNGRNTYLHKFCLRDFQGARWYAVGTLCITLYIYNLYMGICWIASCKSPLICLYCRLYLDSQGGIFGVTTAFCSTKNARSHSRKQVSYKNWTYLDHVCFKLSPHMFCASILISANRCTSHVLVSDFQWNVLSEDQTRGQFWTPQKGRLNFFILNHSTLVRPQHFQPIQRWINPIQRWVNPTHIALMCFYLQFVSGYSRWFCLGDRYLMFHWNMHDHGAVPYTRARL